jgi:hypothetical protein
MMMCIIIISNDDHCHQFQNITTSYFFVDHSHTALASACGIFLVVAAIGAGAMRALLKTQLGVSTKLKATCR